MSHSGNSYPSHNRPGYPDYDRRDPDIPRSDVYRPSEEINTYRDRDRNWGWGRERSRERSWERDRDRDRERSWDQSRDWDYERGCKSGRDADRDKMAPNTGKPDKLRLDTKRIPTGPRGLSSKDSPMSARSLPSTARATPTEPSASRKASSTTSVTGSLTGLGSPKGLPAPGTKSAQPNMPRPQAKDPKQQELLDAIVNLGLAAQNQSHYRFRWDKIKRDLALQQRWLDKHLEKEDDFPGRADYETAFNKGLKKEAEDLNKKLFESDEAYSQGAQNIVAMLYKAITTMQPVPAVAESSSSNVEKELAELRQQLAADRKENAEQLAELKQQAATDRSESAKLKELSQEQQKRFAEQAKTIQTLKEECDSTLKASNALKSELKTIKSMNSLQSLQEQVNNNKTLLANLKAEIGKVDQFSKNQERKRRDFEASHKTSLLGKADAAKISGLNNKIDELTSNLAIQTKEQAKLKERVEHLSHHPPGDAAVRDPSQENSETKEHVGPLTTVEKLQVKKDADPVATEVENMLNFWVENNMEDFVESTKRETKAIQESVTQLKTTQERQEAFISEQADALRKAVITIVDQMGDTVGELVDEANARITEVEKRTADLEAGAAPGNSKTPPGSTGAWDATPSALMQGVERQMHNLAMRVDMADSHKLPERFSHLEDGLRQLQEKLQQQQQQQAIHPDHNDLLRQIDAIRQDIEALQLATKSLNGQWSNLQTKGMAEIILAQLNPYAMKQYNTYTKLEQEQKALRAELADIASVVARAVNSAKRPASPANGTVLGPAKRQRIDEVAQQQQQSRLSSSSRQSSLARENIPPREGD